MKNSTHYISKRLSYYLLSSLLIFTFFSSCKKDEVDTNISSLRVVNASPSLGTYNVYLAGSRINAAALPFAGSISYGSHASGSYEIKFTTASSSTVLLSKTIALNPGALYSYYLIDRPASLDGLLIGDDVSVGSADKAYIRFINLSPDASSLDLAKTGSTTLISGKTYKTASNFTSIDPATVSLDIKDNVTAAVKATLADVVFTAGFRYDIIAGGLANPANDTERKLSIQVVKIQ